VCGADVVRAHARSWESNGYTIGVVVELSWKFPRPSMRANCVELKGALWEGGVRAVRVPESAACWIMVPAACNGFDCRAWNAKCVEHPQWCLRGQIAVLSLECRFCRGGRETWKPQEKKGRRKG